MVVEKAITACQNIDYNPSDHFAEISKMVPLGKGAEREFGTKEAAQIGEAVGIGRIGQPGVSGEMYSEVDSLERDTETLALTLTEVGPENETASISDVCFGNCRSAHVHRPKILAMRITATSSKYVENDVGRKA